MGGCGDSGPATVSINTRPPAGWSPSTLRTQAESRADLRLLSLSTVSTGAKNLMELTDICNSTKLSTGHAWGFRPPKTLTHDLTADAVFTVGGSVAGSCQHIAESGGTQR